MKNDINEEQSGLCTDNSLSYSLSRLVKITLNYKDCPSGSGIILRNRAISILYGVMRNVLRCRHVSILIYISISHLHFGQK